MSAKILLSLICLATLAAVLEAGGHGGGHKKVVIHVPMYVKHHHHKHTIVKHIHHHHKGGGGGDDHYEVLGYTYGEPKAAPHGGGHSYHADDEGHAGDESPVSFEGDSGTGYGLSGAGAGGGADYSEDHSGY